MKQFARLSAQQWGILVNLLEYETSRDRSFQPSVTRRSCDTEVERSCALRACTRLVGRGLIARHEDEWSGTRRYRLAVSPRAILDAVDDLEPASVSIDAVRVLVRIAGRGQAGEERTRGGRREPWGPNDP